MSQVITLRVNRDRHEVAVEPWRTLSGAEGVLRPEADKTVSHARPAKP